ncbi:MAG: UDP-N-acetylglucosamine 2-epimerase (non-hydrolyzing) [Planctomycetota bacterium]|jgi:UDP-N-acetylglucosamine 2-epimerase (non-hydrolysing)
MVRRVAVFLGTRPEAIKMAPVIRALEAADDFDPIVISTGQHREMLEQVVELFELPVHHELDVMVPDQTLAELSARLLTRIDALFEVVRPDIALVQGDTTTVLMAALACFYNKVPVGHVEAGLRTGNIWSPFPEEVNRKLVTPIVDLHFPPTSWSRDHLLDEGVDEERITVTGNTVIDALHIEVARQRLPETAQQIDAELVPHLGTEWRTHPYVLVTGHRRENHGRGFEQICDALSELANRFPDHRFIYPVHLNPRVQGPVHEKLGHHDNIFLLPPQPYRPFVALMQHARMVLTDSGGVQEEAPGLGKPVLVMRDTTERPEGVTAGTVRLVGACETGIVEGVTSLLSDPIEYQRMASAHNPYGDGLASGRIIDALRSWFAEQDQKAQDLELASAAMSPEAISAP